MRPALALLCLALTSLPLSAQDKQGIDYMPVANAEALELIDYFGFRILPADFSERTHLDYERELRAWLERVMVEPVIALMAEDPWKEEAIQFIRQGLDYVYLGTTEKKRWDLDLDELYATGETLIFEKGCYDILAEYVLQLLELERSGGIYTDALFDIRDAHSWEDYPYKDSVPKLLLMRNHQMFGYASRLRGNRKGANTSFLRTAELAAEIAADDSYWDWEQGDATIYLRHFLEKLVDRQASKSGTYDYLKQVHCELPSDPYTKLLSEAIWHHGRASYAYSDGINQDEALKDGLDQEDHLKIARKNAKEALLLRDDRPDAARIILQTMNHSDKETGATAWEWYERAAAAELGDPRSLRAVKRCLDQKDKSSNDVDTAFVIAAAAIPRYDLDTVYEFFGEVLVRAKRGKSPSDVYWEPRMRDALEAVTTNMLLCPERQFEREYRLASRLYIMRQSGKYDLAREALDQMAGLPDERGLANGYLFGMTPLIILGDVRVATEAATKDDYSSYLEAMGNNELAAAMDALTRVEENAPIITLPYLTSLRTTLQTEIDLTKPDWVKIPCSKGLPGWVIRKGDWDATEEGSLVVQGERTSSFIMLQARLPKSYEVRGSYHFTSAGNCCQNMVCTLGVPETGPIEYQYQNRPSFFAGRRIRGKMTGAHLESIFKQTNRNNFSLVKRLQKPPTQPFPFRISLQSEKFSYWVDNTLIFADKTADELGRTLDKDGRLVFGSRRICETNTITIKDLEIRRIPDSVEVAKR